MRARPMAVSRARVALLGILVLSLLLLPSFLSGSLSVAAASAGGNEPSALKNGDSKPGLAVISREKQESHQLTLITSARRSLVPSNPGGHDPPVSPAHGN